MNRIQPSLLNKSNNVQQLHLQAKYDPMVKTLHWTWAFTWIAVWFVGILAVYWRDALNSHHELTIAHKALAMTLLIVIGLRVVWRLIRKPPAAPMTDQERAIHISHIILGALALVVLPLSGWMWSSVASEPVTLLWRVEVPPLVGPAPAYYAVAKWTHVIIAWFTGLLIVLHIAMALKRHFVDRDQSLRRMLPGRLS